MRYLSFDIEATGLDEDCLIIEMGMVPFDSQTGLADELEDGYYIKCPSFEELKPKLDPWVIDHNKELIEKAHKQGKTLAEFKNHFTNYLESKAIKEYFNHSRIVLFGKSMNSIDLPFLNRDLGWDFMRNYFSHRTMDLTSYIYGLIDMNFIPKSAESGSNLMNMLEMGEVAHTALEDARNTALMYLKLLEDISEKIETPPGGLYRK